MERILLSNRVNLSKHEGGKMERRKFARLNVSVEIVCRIGQNKKDESKLISRDVSFGGIRVVMDKSLSSGTLLELELHFSTRSEPVVVTGEVIWQNYTRINNRDLYETGVKFTKVYLEDQEKLREAMLDTVKQILKNMDRLSVTGGSFLKRERHGQ